MDYTKFKVAELKDELRKRKLGITGTKAVLLERLLKYTSPPSPLVLTDVDDVNIEVRARARYNDLKALSCINHRSAEIARLPFLWKRRLEYMFNLVGPPPDGMCYRDAYIELYDGMHNNKLLDVAANRGYVAIIRDALPPLGRLERERILDLLTNAIVYDQIEAFKMIWEYGHGVLTTKSKALLLRRAIRVRARKIFDIIENIYNNEDRHKILVAAITSNDSAIITNILARVKHTALPDESWRGQLERAGIIGSNAQDYTGLKLLLDAAPLHIRIIKFKSIPYVIKFGDLTLLRNVIGKFMPNSILDVQSNMIIDVLTLDKYSTDYKEYISDVVIPMLDNKYSIFVELVDIGHWAAGRLVPYFAAPDRLSAFIEDVKIIKYLLKHAAVDISTLSPGLAGSILVSLAECDDLFDAQIARVDRAHILQFITQYVSRDDIRPSVLEKALVLVEFELTPDVLESATRGTTVAVLNIYNKHGRTISNDEAMKLVDVAINTGNTSLLSLVLGHGVKPTVDQLKRAITNGNPDVVVALVEAGGIVPVDALISYEYKFSKDAKDYKMIVAMVDGGANVHAGKEYALRQMIKLEDVRATRYLIEHGARTGSLSTDHKMWLRREKLI